MAPGALLAADSLPESFYLSHFYTHSMVNGWIVTIYCALVIIRPTLRPPFSGHLVGEDLFFIDPLFHNIWKGKTPFLGQFPFSRPLFLGYMVGKDPLFCGQPHSNVLRPPFSGSWGSTHTNFSGVFHDHVINVYAKNITQCQFCTYCVNWNCGSL